MKQKKKFNRKSLIIDIEGKSLTQDEKKILSHPFVAGVLLLERNYESKEQVIQLIKEIKQLQNKRLLVMTDHEGGPVQRFRANFLPLPSMSALGELYDKSPTRSLLFAEQIAWASSIELMTIGVDINLSPVVDLQYEQSVYKKRSIHGKKEIVTEIAIRIIKAMQSTGLSSVIKHYPGHGATNIDSHYSSPVDSRPWVEIESNDLYPFSQLIKQNIVDGIMTGHLTYQKINKQTVTYSEYWLKKILREKLCYKGIIFSDDLSMEAAKNISCPNERVDMALKAGCNYVIMTHDKEGVSQVLDNLDRASVYEDRNDLFFNKNKISKKELLSIRFKRISEKINNFYF